MTSKGYRPDVVSYIILINGYCKMEKVEEAMILCTEMVSKGITSDVVNWPLSGR